ncbi:MAG TPA: pitrilysin family protein [Vicinamibacterales bacterium]|nr:pitrilysin family protein [Vicinamibacterales bacterium]
MRIPHFAAALALLAIAVTAGSQPVAAQAPPARLAVPYQEFTLANGLHVILHRDTSAPIVTLNVWYHVGSGSEKPGRTGLAHLFEHLMFEGSKHVPEGAFDTWLEGAGADNNGSTTVDRTNYYINGPSNALELMLFLESDRMGYLLDTMTPERVDGQRDVVKNERRQSYENRPYGMAELELDSLLFPPGHPYSWSTIGSMADLRAASYQDMQEFFRTYYAPNNASVVIAGDIDPAQVKTLVEKWFGEIPRGQPVLPVAPPAAMLTAVTRKTMTDKVQLPRLYLGWLTPATYRPGDAALDIVAALLSDGKNSRLYKRLVYDLQIAQDVVAYQQSQGLGSVFMIQATARPGTSLDEIQKVVDEEIDRLAAAPPDARELERVRNSIEATFLRRAERVGGMYGKADQMNAYYTSTGTPDFFEEDIARYRALDAADISSAVGAFLPRDRRVELVVMPEDKP